MAIFIRNMEHAKRITEMYKRCCNGTYDNCDRCPLAAMEFDEYICNEVAAKAEKYIIGRKGIYKEDVKYDFTIHQHIEFGGADLYLINFNDVQRAIEHFNHRKTSTGLYVNIAVIPYKGRKYSPDQVCLVEVR